jgi:alpha-D-xyloside xylohydrolase
VMLSTWAKFYTSTDNFAAMQARGFMLEPNLREGTKDFLGYPFSFYDAFNPAARDLYWQQMEPTLFRRGVDAWWMDASEPEMRDAPMYEDVRDAMGTTAQGAASRVMLAYPLLHNEGFYQHHRAAAPDQRVFILTRSGFAGLQRTAAACWSGDITSTWSALRQQIPAGLSLGLSGLPYWTTDSGGFSVPPRWAAHDAENRSTMTPEDAAEWAELNTRWLQYATFCPLMRIHGQFPLREIWEFGEENSPAFQTMVEFDLLRYRMLPYIYSVAGAITHEGGTLMRALVMDFPHDAPAREIGDQFMFGPSLLISPVTTYQARTQSVYLPTTPGGWYDFWTGETLAGGKRITAPAPFERIPVHVRAGAIVPFGPAIQYTTEKPADPLTVLVYAGTNGAFALYEDDGLSYGYERGEAARIAFRWDDQARTLTIGAREGSFTGMLETRTMNIVLVARARHPGATGSTRTERTVTYKGVALTVAFKQ